MPATRKLRLMAPSVSIPEKTLEHWASQYVTYRYSSKAALWWPARGEDVDVRWLPTRPGKVVQLELKTTTIAGAGLHDVLIDLGQLWEYCQRPLGHQPFYVFPSPHWGGELNAAARAKGHPVTELAFARSGSGWWFADWMVVLTTAQVADTLRPELTVHSSTTRGKRKRLVQFNLNHAPTTATWGSGGTTPPDVIWWRDFWTRLELCGRPEWPQMIMLPAYLIQNLETIPRPRIIELLSEVRDMMQADRRRYDEFVTLMPDVNGLYQIGQGLAANRSEPENAPASQVDDHRQVVFIDAQALLRTR